MSEESTGIIMPTICNNRLPRRIKLTDQQLEKVTLEDMIRSWHEQDMYIDVLESQATSQEADIVSSREAEERMRQQHLESTHREKVLVRRLATKEQEMQEYASQIAEFKAGQTAGSSALRSALLDPAVNLLLQRLRGELLSTRTRLEETQNELSAWKFTPDSNTGKRLMAKCRLLYQENEELGRMISSGRLAKLEGELALQKSFSDEVKKSQSELDEFLQDLDEDVEGMQSTIYYLQQELRKAKEAYISLQQQKVNQSSEVAVVSLVPEKLAVAVVKDDISDVDMSDPLVESEEGSFYSSLTSVPSEEELWGHKSNDSNIMQSGPTIASPSAQSRVRSHRGQPSLPDYPAPSALLPVQASGYMNAVEVSGGLQVIQVARGRRGHQETEKHAPEQSPLPAAEIKSELEVLSPKSPSPLEEEPTLKTNDDHMSPEIDIIQEESVVNDVAEKIECSEEIRNVDRASDLESLAEEKMDVKEKVAEVEGIVVKFNEIIRNVDEAVLNDHDNEVTDENKEESDDPDSQGELMIEVGSEPRDSEEDEESEEKTKDKVNLIDIVGVNGLVNHAKRIEEEKEEEELKVSPPGRRKRPAPESSPNSSDEDSDDTPLIKKVRRSHDQALKSKT